MAKSAKKNPKDNLMPPWEKGKSGNPKGRPPKLVSHFLGEFEKAGYEGVKPSQVQGLIEFLLNFDKSELIDLWDKKDVPVIIATMAKELSRSDKAWQVINDMLDRAHGKSTAKHEVETNGEFTFTIRPTEGDSNK